jgi:signal transduction histidine kinase
VGLALSRQLIEAAGGSLTLAGREGGGARAVIELPEERD